LEEGKKSKIFLPFRGRKEKKSSLFKERGKRRKNPPIQRGRRKEERTPPISSPSLRGRI